MFRTPITIIVLIALINPIYTQPKDLEKQSLDSILTWLNGNYWQDSTDYHAIGLRALSKSKKGDDIKLTADLHSAIASWHGFHAKYKGDSLLYHDNEALNGYIAINDSFNIANTYRLMSTDYLNYGNPQKANEVLFKAIDIFQSMNDELSIARCHRSLGDIATIENNYDQAIKYAELAKEIYEKNEDYNGISFCYMTLISTYNSLNQHRKAYDIGREALNMHDTYIPNEWGIRLRLLGYKSEASAALDYLDEALKESTQAYELALKHANSSGAADTYRGGIGDVLVKQGNHAEAIPHYEATIQGLREESREFTSPLFLKLSNAFKETDNLKEALNYYVRYTESLQLINEQKVANLESEAVIKYETGKKDQALAAQELQIAQQSKIQWLGGGALFLTLSLLGALFWNYKKNKKYTIALGKKNTENEFLVKEIHHRVKNNLQILSSLLSLQSNYIKDEAAADAIKEGRNRVESMGMIHQRLYSEDQKAAINLKEYIEDLCAYLSDSFLLEDQNINIKSSVQVDLVDVETAIPLGLVINELITNSIKYAFPENKGGTINVSIVENDEKQLCLQVKDDGIGSTSFNTHTERATNFGSDLIKILIKKLKGALEQSAEEGFVTNIKFDRYTLVS